MFPLKNKVVKGYRIGEWTFYHTRHRGTDFKAYYEYLYAPEDGQIIIQEWGNEGGYWLYFLGKSNILYKFAHLSKYYYGPGNYIPKGAKIAKTGNTGSRTTGAHLHMEMWKNGKQINPETFNFLNINPMLKLIREKGRNEIYAKINGRNYYLDRLAFEDLLKEKLVSWDLVEETNEQIMLDGIIK